MPRKKSNKSKNRIIAARRHQETPEQRSVRLEKARIQAALRRASESAEEREVRLARERARTNAARKKLREKARCASKKLDLHGSLPRVVPFESYVSAMNGRELSNYRAYIKYNEMLKAAANSASLRRMLETPEQRSLRLEKGRLRAAAIRACESLEKRAARLLHQRTRVREARAKVKGQQDFKERSNHLLQENQTPSELSDSQENKINRFRPRFRGGLCPKIAGNYNLTMEDVDIECEVILEVDQEPINEDGSTVEPDSSKSRDFTEMQVENSLFSTHGSFLQSLGLKETLSKDSEESEPELQI